MHQRFARVLFLASATALALALLVQAFLAGIAAMADPSWWEFHRTWVHIFQWLVVLLPASALAAGFPRWLKWASAVPVVIIYFQYTWAELGREGLWAYGFGVHAVAAFILFATVILLLAAALQCDLQTV